MTLSQLATLNKASGGHFFNRDTMTYFGDTMKSFSIKTDKKAGSYASVFVDRVIGLSYRLLGLISFLTAGPDEVRAWPIPDGSTAVDAAAALSARWAS